MDALTSELPVDKIKKDGMLCMGGDVRAKGNRWLYTALERCNRQGRLLRERKFRAIVSLLDYKHKLCQGLTGEIYQKLP